jgi:translation initiation factor IF-1
MAYYSRMNPPVASPPPRIPEPSSQDAIEVEGKIIAVLPGTMFRVELPNKHQVLAHISGKLRKNFIKITVGDMVKMEMSPYDLNKARITYRLRNAPVNRGAPMRSFGPRRR